MPAGGLGTAALIGAGTQAVSGLVSGISGLFQTARAKKLARENQRPIYGIPQEILANQQLAQQAANVGMPSQEYAQAQKNINQSQANALNAAQGRGGALASIGAIQGQSNQALANLDAQSAAMRMQNIRGLMNANTQLADYRDKAFDYNQAQKYQENAAAARALQAAGQQNINQGIQGVLGAGATIAGGLTNQSNSIPSANNQLMAAKQENLNTFMQNRPTIDTSSFQQSYQMPVFSTPTIQPYSSPQSNITADEAANDMASDGVMGWGKMGRFAQNY
jgi:hypothetical protein